MTYAIIGTGNVGTALARAFADHEVAVTIANTRGPDSLGNLELGPHITPASIHDALNADLFRGAQMVKAFNQTPAGQLNRQVGPEHGKRVVFIASNSPTASATIADLAIQIGFAPVEIGRIDEGGVLIQARNALTLRNLYELPQ
jgi:predicted dinucleotide-binding enzyme